MAAAGAGGGGGGSGGSGGSGGRRSTPRGRPGRGRGRRPRRPQPSPSLPWTPPSRSQQATPPRTLNQVDLQRRLRMLLQDQEQLAQGREIANVTMSNNIVTSYKQGGRPSVQSTSSRYSSWGDGCKRKNRRVFIEWTGVQTPWGQIQTGTVTTHGFVVCLLPQTVVV